MKAWQKIGVGIFASIAALVALAGCFVDFSKSLSDYSDEELKTEREKLFRKFNDTSLDDSYRDSCLQRMHRIDDEQTRRAWGDREPRGPGYHREHGYNLYKQDD